MTDEIISLPETDHASRIKDMLLMRSMNISERYIIDEKNIVDEMNIRLFQYRSEFTNMQFDRLVLQTVQDFQHIYSPLQLMKRSKLGEWKYKIDCSQPVAQLGKKYIYAHEDGVVAFTWEK